MDDDDLKILEKCMIVGIVSFLLTLPFLIPVLSSETKSENLAWVGIIISAGIGVIIAIIVDERAKQSHQEVVNSQETITNLLGKLDETDKKHRESLSALQKSREDIEKISSQVLEQNLNYITDIIDKIKDSLGNNSIPPNDAKKLLAKVLPNLESPLNILTQVIPQIITKLKDDHRKDLTKSVATLRKFIILVSLETKYNEKEIISKLIEENTKLGKLKEEIKSKNNS